MRSGFFFSLVFLSSIANADPTRAPAVEGPATPYPTGANGAYYWDSFEADSGGNVPDAGIDALPGSDEIPETDDNSSDDAVSVIF